MEQQGQISNDNLCFQGHEQGQNRKRPKSIFQYLSHLEIFLVNKKICSHCFQIVEMDDEYIDKEEIIICERYKEII